MTTSAEQIVELYRQRKNAAQPLQSRRERVRKAYNGELEVELPDMGRVDKAAVANLINTGMDQLAMRVSSTLPTIFCPPRDEHVKREVTTADKRKRALYGWWEANSLDIMVPRRARQMLAYAQSPVQIWPDFQRGIPTWRMRDPMGTFPAATLNPGDYTPTDCIFAYTQTHGYVQARFPDAYALLMRKETCRRDDRLVLLDYVDADELVTLVLGEVPTQGDPYNAPMGEPYGGLTLNRYPGFTAGVPYRELSRLENRAGVCTAVVPGRITLDQLVGHFDGVVAMYQMMARLMALEIIAVEKGIFPDTYLEGRDNVTPEFISGPHDGRTGKVNVVRGGVVRELGTAPGFQTNPTIDRIERAMRLTAGIPAEFGGEAASNVRTGRRGDAVLSAAVDFPVQEQQKVLAASLLEENKRAIAVAKGYFGSRPQSFYVSAKGAKGQVDFKPSEIFTTDEHKVYYAHAGSDLNGITIMAGQLVGMGVLSRQGAAEMLPIIDDPEKERDRSTREALESALLAAFQQKVNAGEVAPADAAWVMEQVVKNKLELPEAIIKLDDRVKARQAAQPDPADPMAAMAGLATGTPAEAQAVPAAIAGPNESQDNLASLLGRLRQPQMTLASERPAV